MSIIAIIAGGRDFTDYPLLRERADLILSALPDQIVIMSGMAEGADLLGIDYAKERGHAWLERPATWRPGGVYDHEAGFKRNTRMAEEADALIAFWDWKSRGTRHMISEMRRFGKGNWVRIVKYGGVHHGRVFGVQHFDGRDTW